MKPIGQIEDDSEHHDDDKRDHPATTHSGSVPHSPAGRVGQERTKLKQRHQSLPGLPGRLWFKRAGARRPRRSGLFCEESSLFLRRPPWLVELAGIEPASFGVEPGLLRVQSVVSFSLPRRSH